MSVAMHVEQQGGQEGMMGGRAVQDRIDVAESTGVGSDIQNPRSPTLLSSSS